MYCLFNMGSLRSTSYLGSTESKAWWQVKRCSEGAQGKVWSRRVTE